MTARGLSFGFAMCSVGLGPGVAMGQLTIEPLAVSGTSYSHAGAVNSDGTVITGSMFYSSGGSIRTFRWTSATGAVDICGGSGTAINSDGSVIGGQLVQGFRWHQTSGQTLIPLLPNCTSATVTCMSGSGHVLGGNGGGSTNVSVPKQPFRYTYATGPVPLGLPGNYNTEAELVDMSNTGQTCLVNAAHGGAYLWTPTSGYSRLPLSGPVTFCLGRALSSDGNVVVGEGYGSSINGNTAIRVENGSVTVLSQTEGYSMATDCSAEGQAIVGWNQKSGTDAFVWNSTSGMVNLLAYLKNHLVIGARPWSSLGTTPRISDDGKTIVGVGMYQGREAAYRIYRAAGWDTSL